MSCGNHKKTPAVSTREARCAPRAFGPAVSAHGASGAVRTGRGGFAASRLTSPAFVETAAPFNPARADWPTGLGGTERGDERGGGAATSKAVGAADRPRYANPDAASTGTTERSEGVKRAASRGSVARRGFLAVLTSVLSPITHLSVPPERDTRVPHADKTPNYSTNELCHTIPQVSNPLVGVRTL
jgi:hypothetical protein